MKFKETNGDFNKEENLLKAKEMIENLKKQIPEIIEMKCGLNCNSAQNEKSFDLAIDSIFNNVEELEKYKIHPAHLELVDFINSVREKTSYVDYEL